MQILLGDKLKELRNAKKMSLRELSEVSGVSYSTIARYERNEVEPSFANMARLSGALGVDIADLTLSEDKQSIYVENQSSLIKWSNKVSADESLSDYACLIILALPMFADPSTWIVSITIDSFVNRVKRLDIRKVEAHWQEVLDSDYIERIGTGEWTLRLKFPD